MSVPDKERAEKVAKHAIKNDGAHRVSARERVASLFNEGVGGIRAGAHEEIFEKERERLAGKQGDDEEPGRAHLSAESHDEQDDQREARYYLGVAEIGEKEEEAAPGSVAVEEYDVEDAFIKACDKSTQEKPLADSECINNGEDAKNQGDAGKDVVCAREEAAEGGEILLHVCLVYRTFRFLPSFAVHYRHV